MLRLVNLSSKQKFIMRSENENSYLIYTRNQVIYSSSGGQFIKYKFEDLTSVCCKKLG